MEPGRYHFMNGRLLRADPYPPVQRSTGKDVLGRPLPSLPTTSPPFPQKIYHNGASFTLLKPKSFPPELARVTITESVDVGWCNLSQAVLAHVDSGTSNFAGESVFLKFFDPLYLNPDELPSKSSISPRYLLCLTLCRA